MRQHPSAFSKAVLEVIGEEVYDRVALYGFQRLLDPLAGIGRIHELDQLGCVATIGVEIEPEWAREHPNTIVANALALPFGDETFDVIATSPAYGNRMADHHQAKDSSKRHTYTHVLGRTLHTDNTGKVQWGDEYRRMHQRIWYECRRVLRPGGSFILNTSDHIRGGEIQHVTAWHHATLHSLGFTSEVTYNIPTPRLRHGENHQLRVDHETVAHFKKAGPYVRYPSTDRT